jgi:ATP-dependent DNA helicase Q1
LLVQLILSHHLKEDFHSTSYSINVYVISGPQAMRLTRLSREAVESGAGQRITCTFLKKAGRKAAAKSKRKDAGLQSQLYQSSGQSDSPLNSVPGTKTKKRRRPSLSGKIQDVDDFIVEDDGDVIHTHGDDSSCSHSDNLELEIRRISPTVFKSSNQDDDDDDVDIDGTWTFTLDDAAPKQKRRRTDNHNAGPGSEDEVVVLSD